MPISQMSQSFDITILHSLIGKVPAPVNDVKDVNEGSFTEQSPSPFKEHSVIKTKPARRECNTDECECVNYIQGLKQGFRIAFDFLEKHKYARTDEEWQAVFVDIDMLNDEYKGNKFLLVDLLPAMVNEIERNYLSYLMKS